jgi:hypothetical protein
VSAHVGSTAETPQLVTRRCACGGYITADPRHPYPAVARHNATIEHAAWWRRERVAWGEEPCAATARLLATCKPVASGIAGGDVMAYDAGSSWAVASPQASASLSCTT